MGAFNDSNSRMGRFVESTTSVFFLLFAIADAWIVSNFPAASSSNCGDDAMISMLKFFLP